MTFNQFSNLWLSTLLPSLRTSTSIFLISSFLNRCTSSLSPAPFLRVIESFSKPEEHCIRISDIELIIATSFPRYVSVSLIGFPALRLHTTYDRQSCLVKCNSSNNSLWTTVTSEIGKLCIHVLLLYIIHCSVVIETCKKQEINLTSSKIHPAPRVLFNHAYQTPTTHMSPGPVPYYLYCTKYFILACTA